MIRQFDVADFRQDADRGANRAFRRILEGARKAEIGQHAVAHEFGDEAAIASDRAGGRVLITPDHPSEQFRIDFGRQRRRADHIGEQHRHLTPLGIAGTGFARRVSMGRLGAASAIAFNSRRRFPSDRPSCSRSHR